MTILTLIIASILCGVLGRMGGSGNYPRQVRVVGIPATLCMLSGYLALTNNIQVNIVCLVITLGLLCASVSTYWDWIFGYDNFWFHGFMIGLSFAPIAFPNHWLGFAISTILCTLWMGFWSKIWNWDIAEEFGRYAILPFCVWLLFI